MSPDYGKRDYLLPQGCKDLIDVIKLQAPWATQAPLPPGAPVSPPGEILVGQATSVGHLAALLGQKPLKIIADLMELGIFANVKQLVPFEVVGQVARKYGYTARRPGGV